MSKQRKRGRPRKEPTKTVRVPVGLYDYIKGIIAYLRQKIKE